MAKKTVLKALVTSALSLLLSSSMLVGATFAWFTDLAESKSNIIQTGTLQIGMYWSEGDLDVPTETSTSWADASKTAIFDNKNWAPGYFEAKHIKIANEGSLDFKWQMRILANGVVSKLAEAIDVYYFEDAQKITSASLVENKKLGTLSQVLNNTYENAISAKVTGTVSVEEKFDTVTLAFKMQDDAGNQYQNLSIGTDFSVQILATQYGNGYDNNSEFGAQETPSAMVKSLAGEELDIYDATSGENLSLDTGYQFEPTETYEQAIQSEKRYWIADFAVSADNDVAANSMMLAGYYKLYADYIENQTGEKNAWVGLTAGETIKAGTEICLLELMGFPVNYEELCNFGNDGTGFRCGAVDLDDSNAGTTLTVELRLYETYTADEAYEKFGNHSTNYKKADYESDADVVDYYITIGTFTYTFGGEYVTAEDGAVFFMGDNGDMVLSDTANVTATEYNVPEGVTAIGDYAFYYNQTIKDVVLSSTVRDIEGAFIESKVENVVLNEGLETIGVNAFKKTYNLKSVTIPNTVKTIEETAFQQTGLTEIVVPASVETVEHQAFVSSKMVTATFEGNVVFDNRPFRGCADLRTVYLNGDEVSFINTTTNGDCWFSNKESNNPNYSNITFYVQNDEVASKVRAAMGAELPSTTPIIVNGQETTVVNVGTVEKFQEALNDAVDGTVINFTADITGNVKITQKADVDLIINGNDYKYTGIMTVFGDGRQEGAETLTIKNINFVAVDGAESCIYSPDREVNDKYSYSHNVTVEGCTFTDPGSDLTDIETLDCAAIRHGDGGDKNWTVTNCVVDNTMHSIFQVNNVEGKLTVNNCKVYSKNGANLNCCTNVEMTGCTFEVKGYAVRFGVNSGGNLGVAKSFLIKDCTLKSLCDDGDAVIMFRASAVDAVLTLTNTTVEGTTKVSGNTSATTINGLN